MAGDFFGLEEVAAGCPGCRPVARWSGSGGWLFALWRIGCVVLTFTHHCLRMGLPAALLCVGWLSPCLLLAEQPIRGYIDSEGQVTFANDVSTGTDPLDSGASSNGARLGFSRIPPDVQKLIEEVARRHQVDADLVRAIVQVESGFNPRAVSSRGAMGLMQLLPATARRFGVRDIFDPRTNLDGGVRYLKHLMEMFDGDLRLSLAAYNAGEQAVIRNGGVPPFRETQQYLRKISRIHDLSASRHSPMGKSRIVQFVDRKGIIHFSNTDVP